MIYTGELTRTPVVTADVQLTFSLSVPSFGEFGRLLESCYEEGTKRMIYEPIIRAKGIQLLLSKFDVCTTMESDSENIKIHIIK